MMTTSAGTFPGMKKARLWKRAILWWFRGRWWAKVLKITALAVILYNVLAFILMWCPPVRGVVLDIETGRPIAGAIVQKSAVGPFIFPAMTQAGARTGGADGQAVTDAKGQFSFSGAFAHPTHGTHAWLEVLWPFQWLNTISITVWHHDYIGASSCAEGLWWRERRPDQSDGYCDVTRYRIPILGFRYKILLRRPATKAEWEVKIGSVNLGGIEGGQAVEQERLFTDLTGYLERWPDGEKAGEYYKLLWETANLVPCNRYEREDFAIGQLSRERLETYCARAAKIIAIAEGIRKPPRGMSEESFKNGLDEEKKQLACGRELLGIWKSEKRGARQ